MEPKPAEEDFRDFKKALCDNTLYSHKYVLWGFMSLWEMACQDAALGLVEQLAQISALAHLYAYLYTCPGADFVTAQTYHHVQMNTAAFFIYVAQIIACVANAAIPGLSIPVCLFLMGSDQLEAIFGEARFANGPGTGFSILDLVYRLQKGFAAAAFKASNPKFNARDRRRGGIFEIARLRDCSDTQRAAISISYEEILSGQWDANKLKNIWHDGRERAIALVERCKEMWLPTDYRDPAAFFSQMKANKDKGWCLARPLGKWIGVRPIEESAMRSLLHDYAATLNCIDFFNDVFPAAGVIDLTQEYEPFNEGSSSESEVDRDEIIDNADLAPAAGDGFSDSGSSDGSGEEAGIARARSVTMTVAGKLMRKQAALSRALGAVGVAGAAGAGNVARTERYRALEEETTRSAPAAYDPSLDGSTVKVGDYVTFPAVVVGEEIKEYMSVVGQVDFFVATGTDGRAVSRQVSPYPLPPAPPPQHTLYYTPKITHTTPPTQIAMK